MENELVTKVQMKGKNKGWLVMRGAGYADWFCSLIMQVAGRLFPNSFLLYFELSIPLTAALL